MENPNSNLEPECDTDGSLSRKRLRSPTPNARDSDSSSSESSGPSPEKRKARRDSQIVSYAHFEFLSQQVAYLTNIITKNSVTENNSTSSANINPISVPTHDYDDLKTCPRITNFRFYRKSVQQ